MATGAAKKKQGAKSQAKKAGAATASAASVPMALREPTILRMKVSDMVPWAGNPREHDAEQIRLLRKSLDHYGLVALPVVQAGTNKLIAGHGRLQALREAGQGDREIPVLSVDLSDEDAIGYAIADNRLTDLSVWNLPQLKAAIVEIDNGAFDMELSGFTADALEDLFPVDPDSGILPGKDADEAPAAPAHPISKLGDLWLLGRHRLLVGDATKRADVDVLMDGKKADCVLTDPPYGVAYESESKSLKASGKASIINDALVGEAFQDFLNKTFENYAAVSSKRAAFYVFYPSRYHIIFEVAMKMACLEVRAQIIWVKTQASFGFSQYKWKHEPILHGAKEGQTPSFLCRSTRRPSTPSRRGRHRFGRVTAPRRRFGYAGARRTTNTPVSPLILWS